MSDAGSEFNSKKFRKFYRNLNVEQAFSSSYHHQSIWQAKAYIEFIMCTLKKYFDTNLVVNSCATIIWPS